MSATVPFLMWMTRSAMGVRAGVVGDDHHRHALETAGVWSSFKICLPVT